MFNNLGQNKIENKMEIILYKIEGEGFSDISYNSYYSNLLDKNNDFKSKTRINKMKKDLLERQKKNRVNKTLNIKNFEENNKEKRKQVLEDMCIYGSIMKEQIKEEKESNPENFIEINDALNLEKDDKELFALGLLGNSLQKNGTEVAIEKGKNKEENEEEKDENLTSLEFITNGMNQKKKYDLHFDFGESKNEEYLNDNNKFEYLKEQIKKKISKDYSISKDEIIVTFPQKGSLRVQVIFESDDFNNLNIDDFKSKFLNDKEFKELNNLKEIYSDVLMSVCKLNKKQLDSRGNRFDGWGINEKRGNKPYYPPIGWIGIGLNVWDKYDGGDNTWIGMNNTEGEWCVAYHGVGRYQESDQVKKITISIINTQFKSGNCQIHEGCEDKYHPGKKVGNGVYCTHNIEAAEQYVGVSEINGKKYKTALMVRVKPDAIRCCNECNFAKDYWVINGTNDEIRPYRILYKEV